MIPAIAVAVTSWLSTPALAQVDGLTADGSPVLPLPPVDPHRQRLDDEHRVKTGGVSHYAAALQVEADPWRFGEWRPEARNRARWRLDVHSPGARSLSLAFSHFALPPGATLTVHAATPDGRTAGEVSATFSRKDQDDHGQLWTPPMAGDRLRLELDAPLAGLDAIKLRLTRVHHGYAGFGEPDAVKAGGCHLDPACIDEVWETESSSVALLSIEGVRYCTGFLLNNTAQDGAPFLVTARHCGITARNAASVVAMWRHEKDTCEAEVDAPSRTFQTGAGWRSGHRAADITLIELDDPPPSAAGVVFAGWDRAEEAPREATAIHHPNTGRKRISFADGALRLTRHLSDQELDGGDHLRVAGWRQGTTEGGSSGAPLFNEDRRVVGVLHGGYAACGNQKADWFGRLAAAWHGPSPSHRLRDWLDPLDLQPLVLDALAPTPE
ncbi:MAG: serine protease [Acidobacteriota bacterium]